MSRNLQHIGLLLFCLFFSLKTHAQMVGTPYPTPSGCTNVATEGQEFWVTFGQNNIQPATSTYLALQLINGSSTVVTVILTFTAKTGTNTANISVPANTSLQVDLSNITLTDGTTIDARQYVYEPSQTTVTNSNSLHITSPAFISAIAFNTYQATTDATILLPPRIWSVEYYNLSYAPSGSVVGQDAHMIIANQNNTNVYINGTLATTLTTAGQVYYALTSTDLTGTHITTDKPAAYFVHNMSALVPLPGNGSLDILFQQLMPTTQWGQYFVVQMNRYLIPTYQTTLCW